ncbi:MAG: hypothetical protein AAB462_00880 [Patescibacteria group bacterium]
MLTNLSNTKSAAVISIVLVCLSFTPFKLLALMFCVILWAVYWPFSKKIDSFLLRLVLAFTLITASQQILAIVFWALNLRLTVPYVVVAQVLAYLLLMRMRLRGSGEVAVTLVSRTDIAALLVSAASVGIMTLGTLHGGPILQQLIRYSTTGFDHTTHISMTLSVYDNQGYAYGEAKSVVPKILYRDFTSYPQGWHLSNSIVWRAIDSTISAKEHPTKLLLMYFLTVQMWYGALVFIFCRLLFMVTEEVLGSRLSSVGLLAGIGFTSIAELFLFFGIQQYGFANFLAPMLYLLSLTVLLFASLRDSTGLRVKANRFWISGLIISGGMGFSWLLAAPVGYILVLMGLLSIFSEDFKAAFKWFVSSLPVVAGTLLLLGLASIQGILQILYSTKVNQLNEDGGIAPTNYTILFGLFVIAMVLIYITKSSALKKTFAAALSGSLLLTSGIYFYQFISAGRQTYYSVKLSFLPFMLLAVLVGSVFVLFAEKIKPQVGVMGAFIFTASLLAFVPVASNMNLLNLKYIDGAFRNLSPYTASQVSDVLINGGGARGNIIVTKHLNYEEDVITTHFLNMMSREYTFCEKTITWYQISSQDSKLTDLIRSCAKENPSQQYFVLASSINYAGLKTSLEQTPNIKVELTN